VIICDYKKAAKTLMAQGFAAAAFDRFCDYFSMNRLYIAL
jgi:hypothetical protein